LIIEDNFNKLVLLVLVVGVKGSSLSDFLLFLNKIIKKGVLAKDITTNKWPF